MVSGWRYRGLSVVGTLILTAIAVWVANHPFAQWLLTTQVPYLGRLQANTLTNGELLIAYLTTIFICLGAVFPLFKPRPRRILDTILETQRRVLVAMLALATIGYFDYSYRLPRQTLIPVAVFLLVVLPLWFVWIRSRPASDERAILVGDDPSAMADIYDTVEYEILGYVSPPFGRRGVFADGGQVALEERDDVFISGHLPRLGGLARLDRVLVDYDVETAYLAFSSSDRAEFFGALDACHEHGVGTKVHREHVDNVLTEDIGDGSIVDVDIEPLDFQDYLLKRVFDVLFASFGLVILSPLILFIAIAIKLDNPGSVLYQQERTAEMGDTFSVYKFRSMIPDAESDSGVKISDEDAGDVDPRVTRVGRILRKTHLDEIPQLWSILVGDMSTVGPRPERPEWDPEMKEMTAEWRKRWFVKPGLTGLAQINNITGFEPKQKLRYDIEYIRRQSFWFDVKIVIRQIWMVFQDFVRIFWIGIPEK